MKEPLQRICSMPPLINDNARILILGTMPSEQSLAQQMYYANERNHFWDFIYRILLPDYPPYQAFDHQTPRNDRYQLLQHHGIALWDVISDCCRKGSSDKDIIDPNYNDVAGLLNSYAITHLFCNGGNALKYLLSTGEFKKMKKIPVIELYSTSTQNPLNTFAVFHQWKTELSKAI